MLLFLGFVMSVILAIKLVLFLLNLLLSNFGRKISCGTKWTSDNGEFAMIVGATGHIGTEYTREFASMGFNLLLVGRKADKLKKLAQDYKEKYQIKEIKLVPVDFNTPESLETVRTAVNSIGSPIVALVNCMGMVYSAKKFAEYPVGFHSDMLNVNVVAPVLLMEMMLPKMLENKRGAIINYSSMCGRFEFPYFSTFSAAKSFMSTLSEILSVEYGPQGITFQNVEPLFVQSYMCNDIKPNCLLIPPALSVYDSMLEVGIETTTFGHWKHKFVALGLSVAVFVFGSRLTTKLIGYSLHRFMCTQEPEGNLTSENSSIDKPVSIATDSKNEQTEATSKSGETLTKSVPSNDSGKAAITPKSVINESNLGDKENKPTMAKIDIEASKRSNKLVNKVEKSITTKKEMPWSTSSGSNFVSDGFASRAKGS